MADPEAADAEVEAEGGAIAVCDWRVDPEKRRAKRWAQRMDVEIRRRRLVCCLKVEEDRCKAVERVWCRGGNGDDGDVVGQQRWPSQGGHVKNTKTRVPATRTRSNNKTRFLGSGRDPGNSALFLAQTSDFRETGSLRVLSVLLGKQS